MILLFVESQTYSVVVCCNTASVSGLLWVPRSQYSTVFSNKSPVLNISPLFLLWQGALFSWRPNTCRCSSNEHKKIQNICLQNSCYSSLSLFFSLQRKTQTEKPIKSRIQTDDMTLKALPDSLGGETAYNAQQSSCSHKEIVTRGQYLY